MKARPLTLSALFLFTALALVASAAMASELPAAPAPTPAPAVAAAPEAPAGDLCLPLSSPAGRSADLTIDLFQPAPAAAAALCNCALGPCPVTNCPQCPATQHCAPIACLRASSTPWINGVCI